MLVNKNGAMETTIHATFQRVETAECSRSIGRPLAIVLILNKNELLHWAQSDERTGCVKNKSHIYFANSFQ